MAGIETIVDIVITEPLPETGEAGSTYIIKGSAKGFDVIGAPPWIYAQVVTKEWYEPGAIEKILSTFERGFPIPITGDFSVDWTPEKEGEYEITLLATPAPLALPVVGVFPITGSSEMMHISIGKAPVGEYKGLKIASYEKITV